MRLEEFEEEYGDKYLVCKNCGEARKMSKIIEEFREKETETIFFPEEIKDLQYKNCPECNTLELHQLNDNIESDAESNKPDDADDHAKSQNDADGQTESDNDSTKPFSI